jgi:inorganic pyrophosphatase
MSIMRTVTATLGLLLGGMAAPAAAEPDEIRVMIEIPAGSAIKYEIDEESGQLEVDRFLSTAVNYPANYGTIPETRAEDGDALDVLVYTRAPIQPGAFIKVRPIGILRMRDRGERDDKILAVPNSAVDPTYDAIREPGDLPAMERQRLIMFFSTYKLLPEGSGETELSGIDGAKAALQSLEAAREAWITAPQER